MLCDHSGNAIVGKFTVLNLIGRIAFPIFAFQITQGYIHTKDIKNYIFRLSMFACISQIPFSLFLSTYTDQVYLNVFFTLALGVIAILGFDKIKNKFGKIAFVYLIIMLGHYIKVDYGAYGIILILMFYILRNKKVFMCLGLILLTILKYIPNIIEYPSIYVSYIEIIIFTCISLIPICLYNGKEGKKAKYLFYIFYPAHLFILYIINCLIH